MLNLSVVVLDYDGTIASSGDLDPSVASAIADLRAAGLTGRCERHRQKYLDVPVAERQAFVFTRANRPWGERAHTLAEFSAALGLCPPDVLAGHLERGDISRWVSAVFGDYVLASRIREIEHLHRLGQPLDRVDALRQVVDDRYSIS